MHENTLKYVDRKLAVRGDLLQKYEAWLQPFLQMQPDVEPIKPAYQSFDITI